MAWRRISTESVIATDRKSVLGLVDYAGPLEGLGSDRTVMEQSLIDRETERVAPRLMRCLTLENGRSIPRCKDKADSCTCPVVSRHGYSGTTIAVGGDGGIAVQVAESDGSSGAGIGNQAVSFLNNLSQNVPESKIRSPRDYVDPDDIKIKWYQLLEKHGQT